MSDEEFRHLCSVINILVSLEAYFLCFCERFVWFDLLKVL